MMYFVSSAVPSCAVGWAPTLKACDRRRFITNVRENHPSCAAAVATNDAPAIPIEDVLAIPGDVMPLSLWSYYLLLL